MQFRYRCRHVGIAFIGTHHDVASLGYAEVGTRHTGIGLHELPTQMHAGHVGQQRGVVRIMGLIGLMSPIGLIGLYYLVEVGYQLAERVAYLLAVNVQGWHHDMTGSQVHHLQDALAQVGLHHVDALPLQMFVQVALFGEHALALHHLFHVVRRQDAADDAVVFVGILRPVHMHAVGLRPGLEHL